MQPFDGNETIIKSNTCHISKKLFWLISSLVVGIVLVLTSLTIYFGLRSQEETVVYYEASSISTSIYHQNEITSSIESTTVQDRPLPVERIPFNLKPELYQWTVTPDLMAETFNSDLLYTFTCLESTNKLILHMANLNIDNTSISIVNSSSNSRPVFHSWSYDEYNQFMIMNFMANFQPSITYTVHIAYSATIDRDLQGLYLSDYTDANGVSRTLLVSHMEPTFARTALPCVDEPARKAIFHIAVNHDPSYEVWTNGEFEHSDVLNDGGITSYFTPTLNMSTFLLALIVAPKSDFACRPYRFISSKNIKSRICGRIGILPQLTYADEVAYQSLNFFNQYFDIDYALPKIEHFAVPDFAGGGMENYGLIIYSEAGLLFDENKGSTSQQRGVTVLVAHEIAHQWFGNLVSPTWWGELWLKEGFADYMETVAADFIEPSWKQDDLFVIEKMFPFMEADSLPTSRPISIDFTSSNDIFLMFDTITYSKGAAFIRMMNMFLGRETFQHGIRNYLKAFSYDSATQEDLWQHLTKASNNAIDVERIMNGWTRQAGYPVIDINRIYTQDSQDLHQQTANNVLITQQPFSLFPSTATQKTWWIPFKYFDQKSFNLSNESPVIWLNNTSTYLSITTSDSNWILANPYYLSIYRVKYDQENFLRILNQLQTNHTHIPNINRGALIDDTFALSRAFLTNVTDAYRLISYLENERDFVPWTAALSVMDQQELLLGDHEIVPEVQRYFLRLIMPLYNSMGWVPINQSTDWRLAFLQPKILKSVCYYGYRECIDTAKTMYRQWYSNPVQNPIPSSLRSIVYCIAAREGSYEEFRFLWNHLEHEAEPLETINLLRGLACTRDRSQIIWLLNQHLSNNSVIREQYSVRSIPNIAGLRDSNQITWIWIQENWEQLFSKWGKTGSGLSRIIQSVTSRFVTVRQLNEFKAFADSIVDKGSVYRQFQLSLDNINASVIWNRENIAAISSFLRSTNGSSAVNRCLPSTIIPLRYDVYVKLHLNMTEDTDRSVPGGQLSIHINITCATDRIFLRKRSIIIREPIEVIGEIVMNETTYDRDNDFHILIFSRILSANTQIILKLNFLGQLNNDMHEFNISSTVIP
ncbi:unnamed protein product [Rotaria sp. Silwood1]|nr:unnamed protein product [Rotaria sp. Silwood1]